MMVRQVSSEVGWTPVSITIIGQSKLQVSAQLQRTGECYLFHSIPEKEQSHVFKTYNLHITKTQEQGQKNCFWLSRAKYHASFVFLSCVGCQMITEEDFSEYIFYNITQY